MRRPFMISRRKEGRSDIDRHHPPHFLVITGPQVTSYMGLPLPRPGMGGPSWEDRGDFMVSSTERMRQAASEAAVRALILTSAGSHTQAMKLSAMSSFITSTPNHLPPEIAKGKMEA